MASTPPGDREVLEFRLLPRARASRHTHIADDVPALDMDEPAVGVRSQADISGTPRLGGAGGQLERARVASCTSESQHEFLDGQVPGVRRCLRRVAASEGHDQWPIERDREALQRVQVRIADAPFDPAFDHASEAGPPSQLDPGPPSSLPHCLDLGPEVREQLAVATVQVQGSLRTSDARHDRAMFNHGPSLALIRALGSWRRQIQA